MLLLWGCSRMKNSLGIRARNTISSSLWGQGAVCSSINLLFLLCWLLKLIVFRLHSGAAKLLLLCIYSRVFASCRIRPFCFKWTSLFEGWYPFPELSQNTGFISGYTPCMTWPLWSSQDQMVSQPWLLLPSSEDMYFLGQCRRKNWCVHFCMLCFPWYRCLRDLESGLQWVQGWL